jgi:VCBS repeat-containing protein
MPTPHPDSNTVAEDTLLPITGNVLSNDEGTGLSVLHINKGSQSQQVNLLNSPTIIGDFGTLRISSNGGYTYTLNNLNVQHLSEDQTVTDSFQYIMDDINPFEGAQTSSLTITIRGKNDAPVVTDAGKNWAVTENAPPLNLQPGLFLADIDSPTLAGATIKILGDRHPQDVLGFANQNGISGTFDAIAGVLTLSGTASIASYQAALNSVTYQNTSEALSTTPRAFTVGYQVSDGLALSNVGTVSVSITGVNDPPHAVNDTANVVSFGTTTGKVLSNDTDVEGTSLTIQEVNGTALPIIFTLPPRLPIPLPLLLSGTFGALTINHDGSYTYAAANAAGVLADDVVQDTFTYKISDGSSSDTATLTIRITGRSTGTERDDIITGNAAGNTLRGLGGNDKLDGGKGIDKMDGGAGNDIFFVDHASDGVADTSGIDAVFASTSYKLGARAAIETLQAASAASKATINLTGSTIANVIVGNAGANTLTGLAGNDNLDGGAGNDVLTGGLGRDILTGGLGADRFDFNLASESPRGGARDTVNFSHAQHDKIDLRDIDADTDGTAGNQAFVFIGGAAFSGVDGQLRFSGGLLQGDTNGDRVADLEIRIIGALLAGDVIL